MFSLRKVAPPALFMATLLVSPVFAAEPATQAAKEPVQEQKKEVSKAAEPAKDQAKPAESAKDQAKPAAAAKDQATSVTGPAQVMVRVNGTPITRRELDRAMRVLLAQNQVTEPSPEILKQVEAAALDQLTSAELLYQEAGKLVVKDLEKQVTEKVAKGKAKFANEIDYEKALKEVDMTEKDIQDFSRKDIVITNFIEQRFTARVSITDEDARKFYQDNLDLYFKKPESATASHILIGTDDKTSAEERKSAREKAEAILKRVKAGEDFAAIAKAESSCPSSAQGGDLGSFERGKMVPAFDNAVFALKPGEISDVVETQFGYHIIKLTSKKEASTDKYEEVKGKIVDFLKKERLQKELLDFVDGLRKTAKIEKP